MQQSNLSSLKDFADFAVGQCCGFNLMSEDNSCMTVMHAA